MRRGAWPPPSSAQVRATASWIRFFLRFPHWALARGEAQYMATLPEQQDPLALRSKRLHRQGFQVLAHHDELPARLQRHEESRVRPDVDDLADRPEGRALVGSGLHVRLGDPDLLRTDREDTVLADDRLRGFSGEEIRGPDEARHEGR